jgi:hypothetical protein
MKAQSACNEIHRNNDNNVNARLLILNVVLQEATTMTIFSSVESQGTTTTVDRNKRTRSPKQQPTL